MRLAARPGKGYLVCLNETHRHCNLSLSMVNTQTAPRRKLRLESIDELLKELDAIEVALLEGKVHTTGNWTVGQIMTHLAAWIEYGYDGFPIKLPLLPIRWILRLMLPGMHLSFLEMSTSKLS